MMLESQQTSFGERSVSNSTMRHSIIHRAVVLAVAGATSFTSPVARAQSGDSLFAARVRGARALLAANRGRLWSARLDTLQWMGVENGRRIVLTADPHAAGYAREGDVWTGALPAGITPSNTSVTWNGRRWAMVLLPLYGDSAVATQLLIHEAMHVEQPSLLPKPEYTETATGSGLLDEPIGRTLLREEWRALAAALRVRPGLRLIGMRARRDAIRDALIFRAARYAEATPDEITRERALDVTEGMPEYTALRLTHVPARAFAAQLDSAPDRLPSFVRGFVYYTGPAYGMLLDDYEDAAWRTSLRALPDPQRLLYVAWHDRAPRDPDASLIATALAGHSLDAAQRARLTTLTSEAAARYGGAETRAAEDARWAERQKEIAEYRVKFLQEPTLRIRPKTLNISFDPRRQASLGDSGTVMANLAWRGPDGAELHAPAGALVTPNWDEVRLPLGTVQLTPGPLAAPLSLQGDGWTLVLPAGWVVSAKGNSLVLTPPAP